jgi:hypothetical protein
VLIPLASEMYHQVACPLIGAAWIWEWSRKAFGQQKSQPGIVQGWLIT